MKLLHFEIEYKSTHVGKKIFWIFWLKFFFTKKNFLIMIDYYCKIFFNNSCFGYFIKILFNKSYSKYRSHFSFITQRLHTSGPDSCTCTSSSHRCTAAPWTDSICSSARVAWSPAAACSAPCHYTDTGSGSWQTCN